MIERMKANTARVGRGSFGRGAAIVVGGCIVVFVVAGLFFSQPTVAVGLTIGWVVGLLAFGMGTEAGPPPGPSGSGSSGDAGDADGGA